jgi:hypothetical protein
MISSKQIIWNPLTCLRKIQSPFLCLFTYYYLNAPAIQSNIRKFYLLSQVLPLHFISTCP